MTDKVTSQISLPNPRDWPQCNLWESFSSCNGSRVPHPFINLLYCSALLRMVSVLHQPCCVTSQPLVNIWSSKCRYSSAWLSLKLLVKMKGGGGKKERKKALNMKQLYKFTLGWMYYRDKPSSGSSRSLSRVVLLSPGHVVCTCALTALQLASTREFTRSRNRLGFLTSLVCFHFTLFFSVPWVLWLSGLLCALIAAGVSIKLIFYSNCIHFK